MSTLIVGCGYLGRRVGGILVRHGDTVFGTVRSQIRADEIARLGIEPVIADVTQPATLAALPSADRMFYCVGFDRGAGLAMRAVYVDGLFDVLRRLSPSTTRLVYASSTGVYGDGDGGWVDEDTPADPQHEAGRVCLEAENRLRSDSVFAARCVVLRFAGLYGPGRIPRRDAVVRGEVIVGDPDKFLNLIHVDDAARAAVAALEVAAPGPIYVVSDDQPVTRREFYERVAVGLNAQAPSFRPPAPGTTEALRESSNKRVSNRRLKRELGVVLEYPDVAAGLAAALSADS
jgi:nucleoside-diphosphate-sugar epimerase